MTSELIQQIDSLLHLDESGALSPHGIGGLARELLEKCKTELNNRAVPDVPELVNVAHMVEFEGTDLDGERFKAFHHSYLGYPNAFPVVRRDQAAEIIAAKDKEIEMAEKHRNDMADKIVDQRTEIAALRAKLAQYEAQEPVAYKVYGHLYPYVLRTGELSEFEIQKGLIATPLYASPAPAADLKAENEKLRGDLRKLMSGYVNTLENGMDRIRSLGGSCDDLDTMIANDPYLRDARAALNVEANDGL